VFNEIFISAQYYDLGEKPLLLRPHRAYSDGTANYATSVSYFIKSIGNPNTITEYESFSIHGGGTLSPDNMNVSLICPNDDQWRLMMYAIYGGGKSLGGVSIMCPAVAAQGDLDRLTMGEIPLAIKAAISDIFFGGDFTRVFQ
jgi:hypothetical protein